MTAGYVLVPLCAHDLQAHWEHPEKHRISGVRSVGLTINARNGLVDILYSTVTVRLIPFINVRNGPHSMRRARR